MDKRRSCGDRTTTKKTLHLGRVGCRGSRKSFLSAEARSRESVSELLPFGAGAEIKKKRHIMCNMNLGD